LSSTRSRGMNSNASMTGTFRFQVPAELTQDEPGRRSEQGNGSALDEAIVDGSLVGALLGPSARPSLKGGARCPANRLRPSRQATGAIPSARKRAVAADAAAWQRPRPHPVM
jgi:hypothetical protein